MGSLIWWLAGLTGSVHRAQVQSDSDRAFLGTSVNIGPTYAVMSLAQCSGTSSDHQENFKTPYSQVGGHVNMKILNETLVCKPLNKREVKFYQHLPRQLYDFVPRYHGTVQGNYHYGSERSPNPSLETDYIVLENLTAGYRNLVFWTSRWERGCTETLPVKLRFKVSEESVKNPQVQNWEFGFVDLRDSVSVRITLRNWTNMLEDGPRR